MKNLWVDVYRPNSLSDYVFKDVTQKNQIENWLTGGVLPNILMSGSAGVRQDFACKIIAERIKCQRL